MDPRQGSSVPLSSPQPSSGDATGGLIPYRNVPALVAYYFGVFSILPLIGFPLGIAAFILGILGLRKAAQVPEAKDKIHAWVGIIAGGLFALIWGTCVVLSVIAMLA